MGSNNLTGQGDSGSFYGATVSKYITFRQYPMNGLSPNSAKNMNYFRDGMGFDLDGCDHAANDCDGGNVGTDALGYTIEFVELKNIRPDENILPENPAIWETEPAKPETDLDIYYAVDGFHPISISNVSEFIPVGSVIKHESSSAIPPGVTITSVDESGEITLSESITIDPAERISTGDGEEPTWGSQEA